MNPMRPELEEALRRFTEENRVRTKGWLSVVVTLTRDFAKVGLPIDSASFKTEKKGQVKGLGGARLKKLLAEHGVQRRLTSEGGRTSRASIHNMEAYAAFCNSLGSLSKADWDQIEQYWIARVQDYFSSEPIRIPGDRSVSLQEVVRKALGEAHRRQQFSPGATYEGSVLQHLVGAKLETACPGVELEHHPVSQADEGTSRPGDFLIHETAIHVSISPSMALMEKCKANLESGLRCVVVTAGDAVKAAEVNARQYGIENRIEIWEVAQFVSTNISEWSGFQSENLRVELERLLDTYNRLVDEHEGDPSLRLEFQ